VGGLDDISSSDSEPSLGDNGWLGGGRGTDRAMSEVSDSDPLMVDRPDLHSLAGGGTGRSVGTGRGAALLWAGGAGTGRFVAISKALFDRQLTRNRFTLRNWWRCSSFY